MRKEKAMHDQNKDVKCYFEQILGAAHLKTAIVFVIKFSTYGQITISIYFSFCPID